MTLMTTDEQESKLAKALTAMDKNSKATAQLGLQVAQIELEIRKIRAEISKGRKAAKATMAKEQEEYKFIKTQAQDNYDNLEIVIKEQERHSRNLINLESSNATMDNKFTAHVKTFNSTGDNMLTTKSKRKSKLWQQHNTMT